MYAMSSIVLRPWTSSVVAPLYQVLSDPELYRLLPAPPPLSEHEFRKRHDGPFSEERTSFSVHLVREASAAIGLIEARFKCPEECEIGFILGRSHWGQGYATEMVNQCLGELAVRQGSLVVYAAVDSRNYGSIQALRKNGFAPVGEREAMLKFQPSVDVMLRRTI